MWRKAHERLEIKESMQKQSDMIKKTKFTVLFLFDSY